MEFGQLKGHEIIMVVGFAATGKTTLANKIGVALNYEVIHCDDYIGDRPRLFNILLGKTKIVIEGVMCYELLKYQYYPDCIINCSASSEFRRRIRDKDYTAQDKSLAKMWFEYTDRTLKLPTIINYGINS